MDVGSGLIKTADSVALPIANVCDDMVSQACCEREPRAYARGVGLGVVSCTLYYYVPDLYVGLDGEVVWNYEVP